MAAPYSMDLRQKIIHACERGSASQREVAEFFGVSLSFVEKLVRQYRHHGNLEPERQRPGRHALLDAAACEQLQHWLDEQSDLTLAELADRLQARCGIHASLTCVCRALQRLGWHRKKRASMPANATRRRYYWHANNIVARSPALRANA